MATLGVVTGVGVLRSGVTLMARVLGNAGTPITQASLSTLTYTIRDLTAGTTITSAQSLTIASVIYDSLQQSDPRWTKDDADNLGPDDRHGYNLLAVIPASHFTAVDVDSDTKQITAHRYRVDLLFTPVTGQAWIQPFEFTAVPTWTS